jgi:hypothetical protein
MKNKVIKLVLLLTTAVVKADDIAGHTFFTVRPQYRLVAPEKEALFRNDRMLLREGGIEGTTQVVVYGGQSNNDLNINRYFLPSNQTALNVQEYKQPNFTQDGTFKKTLEARNFNIETIASDDTTFKSTIFFRPQQTSIGIGFSWIQNLWHDSQDVPRVWGEISFPVQYIKNEMKLNEVVVSDGGGVDMSVGLDGAPHVANMAQAFKQPNWLYGKVDNCADLHEWGVSDIEITFGYNALSCQTCDFNAYVGFVVPTGTKINQKNAAYIWSPVVGNNHHWGLLFGAHAGFKVFEHKLHQIRLEFDVEGQYLFKNTQWRSFDLVQQGQWSRYLEVYQNLAAATQAAAIDPVPLNMNAGTSGINVFTTCATVHPHFTINTNSGFIYTWRGLQAEFGFNFFVRQAEEITKCSWATDVAIKNINGAGETNIARTIKDNFAGSAIPISNYTPLTLADLDLNSAAHPTTLTHIIYAALGWNWDDLCVPVFFGGGASYEFTTVTLALDRWLLFGKVGISF